jgi:hypothetical protein
LSVNNRDSEYKPAKEKDTARTICICITVISFALLMLVVALPSMYEQYNEKTEEEAIRRLVNISKNTDEDIAASLSAKKSTDHVKLPEVILDDISTKEMQNSAESKVIPRQGGTLSLVYTVQAGSFDDLQSARKLYDYITNDLTTETLAFLRIEQIGQYYAVRIGKFGERSHAEIFHDKIRSQISTAIIIEAYIKEERIKKLHSS